MVQLDFSSETLQICILKILKHSKWHEYTKYYKHHLMPIKQVTIGRYHFTLCRKEDQWFLVDEVYGVLPIPGFMGHSLNNENRFTYWLGPYAFVNNFEATKEGKYLIRMLEYRKLNPRAQQKVDDILQNYEYWVQIDEQFMKILRKRDSE